MHSQSVLAGLLRRAIRVTGLQKGVIAKRAKISRATLSRWQREDSGEPEADKLERLVSVLGLQHDFFDRPVPEIEADLERLEEQHGQRAGRADGRGSESAATSAQGGFLSEEQRAATEDLVWRALHAYNPPAYEQRIQAAYMMCTMLEHVWDIPSAELARRVAERLGRRVTARDVEVAFMAPPNELDFMTALAHVLRCDPAWLISGAVGPPPSHRGVPSLERDSTG